MQFRVDVNKTDQAWQVEVTNVAKSELLLDSSGRPFKRVLETVGDGLNKFPQPTGDEKQKIPDTPDNPHRELCTTNDPRVIGAVYEKYLQRQGEDVVKFGRYLFASLLGDALWQAINDAAGKEPVELALNWKDDYLINRLPWEMMHNGKLFLAQEPEIAITRRVAGTGQTLTDLTSLRVLFVVGSSLNSDVIKPGAEYLGLLRSLSLGAKRRLKTHVLLEASPARVKAAVKLFRPTVVHFICHGYANANQETFLLLKSDEGGSDEMVTADDLLRMLRPDPGYHLPHVVILNACYTASQNTQLYMKSGQAASPIAVKLVEGDGASPGVPIVLGMAGEIADQACRLFTRCFYQAILEGCEVAHAAADGRRVGIIDDGLTDPKNSIDWALPTLFMSAGVEKAEIVVQLNKVEEAWHEAAAEFAPPEYPAFCDRLSFFEWYDCLMVENLPAPQKHNGELQVMAISLREKDKKYAKAKFGRTWLLHQFASNAALDGHLPVLVNLEWIQREQLSYPTEHGRLIEDFKRAMNRTSHLFDLNFTPEYLNLLGSVCDFLKSGKLLEDLPEDLKKGIAQLPKDLRDAYSEDRRWDSPQVQFAALRFDLLSLLELGRRKIEAHGSKAEMKELQPKLLLLIDDIHQMSDATEPLLKNFFASTYGLKSISAAFENGPTAKRDIRVICTYDLSMGLGQEGKITDWLGTARGAKEVPLSAFQPPEDRLAYEYFLSRWRDKSGNYRPLAINHRADAESVKCFFKSLNSEVEGIPELLKSSAASACINSHLNMPAHIPDQFRVLRPVNDEDRLRLISQMKRSHPDGQ